MQDISRETIEQAQAGDMQAFERIYRAASGFVYNVAFRITNDAQESQEVTQDVFLKIHRHLKDFEFRSSFTTWAYRIATNTALTACKRKSRHTGCREDFETVIATHPAPDDSAAGLTEEEERRERQAAVQSLLDRLNPGHRMVIVLREIEGLSYQEISRTLKINLNTVRTRLRRAREALLAAADKGES